MTEQEEVLVLLARLYELTGLRLFRMGEAGLREPSAEELVVSRPLDQTVTGMTVGELEELYGAGPE